jgi:hypothetical protein
MFRKFILGAGDVTSPGISLAESGQLSLSGKLGDSGAPVNGSSTVQAVRRPDRDPNGPTSG